MTEIQAAVGNFQLKKLKYWIKKRNSLASQIQNVLKNISLSQSIKIKKITLMHIIDYTFLLM